MTCAMFDSTESKKGHERLSSRSSSRREPSSSSPIHSRRAVPTPNHPGTIDRCCDHANTHGMARKSEIDVVCLRDDGREPMFRLPISPTGVEVSKNSMKPGSSCMSAA